MTLTRLSVASAALSYSHVSAYAQPGSSSPAAPPDRRASSISRAASSTPASIGWASHANSSVRSSVGGDMEAIPGSGNINNFPGGPLQLVDAFRSVHPTAAGQFTYWSQRARNRPRNRGLRLDYFLLSAGAGLRALRDVQHLQGLEGRRRLVL